MGIDTNGKTNTILNSDAVAVDTLRIAVKGIANLSGIEAFTSLTFLSCWGNQLTSLDVSSNTALTTLDCAQNKLTSLNISSNVALTNLNCATNKLTSLDVSSNIALTNLNCGSNKLTSLDISANTALTNLESGSNPNLSCIQVDDASNIPSNWFKDATVTYSEDCSSLSNKDFKLSGISILPNPTSGILNITAPEKVNYKLFNIKGQVFKKGTLENKIDISSLSKGIYLLNIKINKGSFTKKVVRN